MSVSLKSTTFSGILLDPNGIVHRTAGMPSGANFSIGGWFNRSGTGFESFGGQQRMMFTTTTGTPLDVQVYVGSGTHNYFLSDPTNGPAPQFRVVNGGTTAVTLSQVEVRYWFTEEGTQAQVSVVDYAGLLPSGTNLTSFVTPSMVATSQGNQTHYLKYVFATGAGVLNPGDSAEVQSRFNKTDYSNYTQSNDYSYLHQTVFADSTVMTAYLNGVLVYGIEP